MVAQDIVGEGKVMLVLACADCKVVYDMQTRNT